MRPPNERDASNAERPYHEIVRACEAYLDQYGDSYLGVGWTRSQEEVDRRYQVMLDLIGPSPAQNATILDFGCGASHLLSFMRERGYGHLAYSGLDLSPRYLELSRRKFPGVTYYDADLLHEPDAIPTFDYIVMNGIFNSRCGLSYDAMFSYMSELVSAVFAKARIGMAFNVMSKYVEWERDDLFHVPLDAMAGMLVNGVSRHFVLRHDYGLYEYAVHVYRHPRSAS